MASIENKFLVLEGVDGSGKTTIGRILAEQSGGMYMKTPGNQFKSVRGYVDNGASEESKLLFYLSTVMDASAVIRDSLTSQPVVCDRYVWSSLIPHAAYYGADLEDLEKTWQPFMQKITQPDETILLTVSEDEQLYRMSKNRDMNNLSASDRFCLDSERRERVRNLYEMVAGRDGWIVVDTTGKNVRDITSEINERTGFLAYDGAR